MAWRTDTNCRVYSEGFVILRTERVTLGRRVW
jgi:hypothetical protein